MQASTKGASLTRTITASSTTASLHRRQPTLHLALLPQGSVRRVARRGGQAPPGHPYRRVFLAATTSATAAAASASAEVAQEIPVPQIFQGQQSPVLPRSERSVIRSTAPQRRLPRRRGRSRDSHFAFRGELPLDLRHWLPQKNDTHADSSTARPLRQMSMVRSQFQNYCRGHGADITASVTRATTHLVTTESEADNPTRKGAPPPRPRELPLRLT